MDSENIKFCSTHGIELDDNMICSDCAKSYIEYWKDHPNPPNGTPGKHTNYMLEKLNSNGKVGDRIRNKGHLSSRCLCHNCKYVNWHRICWCPLCGNKLVHEVLTNEELAEKYGSYRTGY